MEITKTFVVRATPDATWAFLTDPRRVAQCLPGAAITEQLDERTHAGTITMKVGPVIAAFRGTMRFERLDAAARTAEIVGSGQDTRGKGGANMHMTSRLVERAPGETEVTITSDVNIIGSLAQFGRGIIQDIADQVFGKFVAAVRAQLETPAEPARPITSEPSTPPTASVAPSREPAANAAPLHDANPSVPPSREPMASVPPIDVFSTASGVMGRAAGRAALSPRLWLGVAVLLLLIYWLFSR
jgi:carbon monoxide dehydrogenase subunit G